VEDFLQLLLDSAIEETHNLVAEKHSGLFLDQLTTLIRAHTATCLHAMAKTQKT
jgi:hypothetical protein